MRGDPKREKLPKPVINRGYLNNGVSLWKLAF